MAEWTPETVPAGTLVRCLKESGTQWYLEELPANHGDVKPGDIALLKEWSKDPYDGQVKPRFLYFTHGKVTSWWHNMHEYWEVVR